MYGFRRIAWPKVPSWVHSDRSLGTTAGLRPVQADMKRNRWPSTTSAACDVRGRGVARDAPAGAGRGRSTSTTCSPRRYYRHRAKESPVGFAKTHCHGLTMLQDRCLRRARTVGETGPRPRNVRPSWKAGTLRLESTPTSPRQMIVSSTSTSSYQSMSSAVRNGRSKAVVAVAFEGRARAGADAGQR